MIVAVVVLAAGESRRLGTPKQLLRFRGRSLLAHAVNTAVTAEVGPVYVVLGAGRDALRGEVTHPAVTVIENPDWERGMGTSIRVAVDLVEAEAILLMVCDQPHVTPDLLGSLVANHRSGSDLVACGYADTLGVPALFGRRHFDELRRLPEDAGAKRVIRRHAANAVAIPFPAGVLDIDTPSDAARLADDPDSVTTSFPGP